MTKINQHQHESFLSLAHEGQEVGNRVCQILADMDAVTSIQRVTTPFSLEDNSDTHVIRNAVAFVDYAENSIIELTEVTRRRKMSNTPEHLELALRAQQLGLRLYRNLWEIALSDADRKVFRQLIRRMASLTVWEDIPSSLQGRSYERITNGMSGTIAYDHAYGVTFMKYKAGQSDFGWSVLRNTLEEAVVVARSSFDLAAGLLAPVV
jgi:hypothetical protein